MEKLYQDYKDLAEFYIVYISEAHAADDRSPVGYATELGIKEHVNRGERCTVATRLLSEKKLTIPCLIDNMDNAVQTAYKGWPDRLFVVRKDGKLAIAAKRGPTGFKPALDRASKWLGEYKKNGAEPDISWAKNQPPTFYELMADMNEAYYDKEYRKSLRIADKMLAMQPGTPNMLYNMACTHALIGETQKALARLQEAVNAGYDDVDYMVDDKDFESVRETDRFKEIAHTLRAKKAEKRAKVAETTPPDKAAQAESGERPLDAAPPASGAEADEPEQSDDGTELEEGSDREDAERVHPFVGIWDMEIDIRGSKATSVMTIEQWGEAFSGVWVTPLEDVNLTDIQVEGDRVRFTREVEGRDPLYFEGVISGNKLEGEYTGRIGVQKTTGVRRDDP